MRLQYEVFLFSCGICSITYTNEIEENCIPFSNQFCTNCKNIDSIKKLGKFTMTKEVDNVQRTEVSVSNR